MDSRIIQSRWYVSPSELPLSVRNSSRMFSAHTLATRYLPNNNLIRIMRHRRAALYLLLRCLLARPQSTRRAAPCLFLGCLFARLQSMQLFLLLSPVSLVCLYYGSDLRANDKGEDTGLVEALEFTVLFRL
jgi:hypothetical protein